VTAFATVLGIWPPEGGGNGGVDEIEEDTFSMGMSPGAMGGKLPGFGNWAKRTLGSLGHAYSQLPTPTNLLFKGIRRWKENREIKRAEQAAIEQAKIDKVSQQSQANAIAAGGGEPQSGITASTTAAQAAGMGGGSQQATSAGSTNSGRTDSGWGWAQGGRIGYRYGDPVIPEDETEDVFELMRDQNIPISEQVEDEITEEQTAMVLDMLEKGMDIPTIMSITGVSQEGILGLMGGTSMAPDSADEGLASLV